MHRALANAVGDELFLLAALFHRGHLVLGHVVLLGCDHRGADDALIRAGRLALSPAGLHLISYFLHLFNW